MEKKQKAKRYICRKSLHMDEGTLVQLKEKAREAGVSRSAYIRQRIHEGAPASAPEDRREKNGELLRELKEVGEQLNQSAHALNGHYFEYGYAEALPKQLEQLKDVLEQIRKEYTREG